MAQVDHFIRMLRDLLQEDLTATQSTDWRTAQCSGLSTKTKDGTSTKASPREDYLEGVRPIRSLPAVTMTKSRRFSHVKGTSEEDSNASEALPRHKGADNQIRSHMSWRSSVAIKCGPASNTKSKNCILTAGEFQKLLARSTHKQLNSGSLDNTAHRSL